MFRVLVGILILLFVAVGTEAGQENARQVRLQAEQISGDKAYLYAKGHIVLHYAQTLFLADLAQYDKRQKRLIVQGDVRIINPDGSRVETQKVTLNVKEEKVVFEKFFYADKENVWLSSVTAEKKRQCYKLRRQCFLLVLSVILIGIWVFLRQITMPRANISN